VRRVLRISVLFGLLLGLLPLAGAGEAATGKGEFREPNMADTAHQPRLPNMHQQGGHLLRLMAGSFDPLQDALPARTGIGLVDASSLPGAVADYWVVQVRSDRFPEVQHAVRVTGGTVTGYLHDDAYLVRATPAQVAQFSTSPAVRWSGYYQPAWRVPAPVGGFPGLMDLNGRRSYLVYVFDEEQNLDAIAGALDSIPGAELRSPAGEVMEVRATAAQVPAMASIPGVEWVGINARVVLLNRDARWVTDTGVRDLFWATKPGRLDGSGQTAAVADTAVNYKEDLNGRAHIAFSDCGPGGPCKEAEYTQAAPGSSQASMFAVVDHNTGHRKMVAFFDIGETGPNPYDPSSHGSHTAGSVDGDQPAYQEHTRDDGIAPAAMHVHQNIGTEGGGLAIPGDLYDLFAQAYRPRNPGSVAGTSGPNGNPADYTTNYIPTEDARTHNNSWGLVAPLVDPGYASRMDQFIWDHEDMVVVASAGNEGPVPASIIAPSLGKNDLSSGASVNGRQLMASIDSMANFSSHGPTADGRYGVDLATPGMVITSVKGGTVNGYHVAQGTSMSGPVLTGLATLVRQYFFDGYARAGGDGFPVGASDGTRNNRKHNPSAALVKATLINGAARMEGWYTGADGSDRAQDGMWPSEGQGFGLVNLDSSLYFANDATNNWYRDVYRADPEAFPVSAVPATRSYKLQVTAGEPLDVTLAWTDAPDPLAVGTPSLVNNLDLVVTAPDGTTYVGNNMNSRTNPQVEEEETLPGPGPVDTRNPVERVRLSDPAAGTYTVSVRAGPIAMGNQGYALAAGGLISERGSFTPGPPPQPDVAGAPGITGVRVTPFSANTAEVTFSTSEPTTAEAVVSIGADTVTFKDVYNLGNPDGYYGLEEGPVETSEDYANRPVVSTEHEILITGTQPGTAYSLQLSVTDQADNTTNSTASLQTPSTVFQADAPDTAQCDAATNSCQWETATQMYASETDGLLGAYMFRLPDGFDPSAIEGASVEMMSSHNWVVPYTEDPQFTVDLLPQALEQDWQANTYESIHRAPKEARAYPETTHKRGDYYRYAFTFACSDLEKLKQTLANEMAAFRWDSSDGGLFSMEFGFNRRSKGAEMRPRLVLYTDETGTNPTGAPCDPAAPTPQITDVGIHQGLQEDGVTVSWETLNVESDSVVLFREQGTSGWTQVGTHALTKVHHVEVLGLSAEKEYEFAVRSAACNGATATDTNGGEGYDFFFDPSPPPDLGARTEHAFYDWEGSGEGWTVQSDSDLPPPSEWERREPGASDTVAANGSRPPDSSKQAWHVSPYTDQDESSLISPPVTFAGPTAEVDFWMAHDLEPTFDFVHVEYSEDGSQWTTVASIDGTNEHYPNYDHRAFQFENPDPGGTLQIRFRFVSDFAVSSPEFLGVDLDKVTLASYANALPEGEEGQPLTGPVPSPSAEGSGINPPATRIQPLARDIAAGTGMCGVAVDAGEFTLTVELQGDGEGLVRSTPRGIKCGTGGPDAVGNDCTHVYPGGTKVRLTAQAPDRDDQFTGWGGDCSGTQNTCTLTMNSDKNVTATFTHTG
jgi:hypothetical protein